MARRIEGDMYVTGKSIALLSTTIPSWQASTLYDQYDLVNNSNSLYTRIATGTSGLVFDATELLDWTILGSGNPQLVGATSLVDGTEGYVPQPVKGDNVRYFKGNGVFETPPNTNPDHTILFDVPTGVKWVNGKMIYRVVIGVPGGLNSSGETVTEFAGFIDEVIDAEYRGSDLPDAMRTNRGATNTGFDVEVATGAIAAYHGSLDFTGKTVYIIIDYTRQPIV